MDRRLQNRDQPALPCRCQSYKKNSQRRLKPRYNFSTLVFFLTIISLLSLVSAELVFDHSPKRATFADLGARRLLERAAQAVGGESAGSTTTSTPDATSTGGAAASSATTTVLAQPFDTSLGNNFTSNSCPQFFTAFLSDKTFRSCYPFSLLLQTSHGFFEAEKNFFQTTRILQAGCSANYDTCNAMMQKLATELKSSSNCLSDYNAENQIVMQAYNGFIAYPVMYAAACLEDAKGDYCFANAITSQGNTSLADAYSYYLPLGTPMPTGNRPSCGNCLKRSMAIYRSYASNSTQPLSQTYVAAARQVNMACGPEWVSDVVQKSSSGSVSIFTPSTSLLTTLLAATLLALL